MTSSCKGYVREKVVFINRDDLCLNDDADDDDENQSIALARSLARSTTTTSRGMTL